jgi:hypothetical protein
MRRSNLLIVCRDLDATFCSVKILAIDYAEMKGIDGSFNKEKKHPGKE